MSPLLIALIAGLGFLVLVVLLIVQRVKVAGPNDAFIITGRKGRPVKNPETGQISTDMSGQKVVMGASVFVLPFVQKLHVMDLSSRRISVGIRGAVSAQGIKCDLDGVAIVKIGGNEDAIRAGAQRFLDQQDGIEGFTQEVLAGSLRAIVGRLTVDEIIKDRAAFASAVAEEAESSLTNQGLALDTFQLQDIQTEGTYLTDIGRPEAARVEMEAAVAEAKARQAAEQERLLAEEAIAIAQRQFELKQAEIKAETDAARARATAAGPLAQASQDQEILKAQELVAVRNAALTDRRLDTEIRKPADAARYRMEQEAEAAKTAALLRAESDRAATIAAAEAAKTAALLRAESDRAATIAAAEAAAEQSRLSGQAERAKREAIAAAVEREGAADASATLAKGEAEAEAMRQRADAYKQYDEAAILEILSRMLPEIVRAASEPVSAIERMTVVSTDGASDITRTVASNVEQGLAIANSLTGIDLRAMLTQLAARSGASGNGSPEPPTRKVTAPPKKALSDKPKA
ncbi:MAG: flotillin family protein [Actinobacteria bacterium]|nr:flotillin family protein [Actinomycetota bacterium]